MYKSSWQRRYFVLSDAKLRYFEDAKQSVLKGVINVSNISSVQKGEPIEPQFKFVIHMQTVDRLYLFNADNEAQRREWLSMLDKDKRATINREAISCMFGDTQQHRSHHVHEAVDCAPNKRLKRH